MILLRALIELIVPRRRIRRHRIPSLATALVLAGLLAAGTASAVELRDAELAAGGSPLLQNGAGTLRLEDARLGRLGPPLFVPEPGALWQLGSGVGFVALLAGRRRTALRTAGAPDRAHPATTSRRMS